jgi:hypothetical protein
VVVTGVCALCGCELIGRRRDARFCSPGHRAEASRIVRLLSGEEVDGYRSVADRVRSCHKRTRDDWCPCESGRQNG